MLLALLPKMRDDPEEQTGVLGTKAGTNEGTRQEQYPQPKSLFTI